MKKWHLIMNNWHLTIWIRWHDWINNDKHVFDWFHIFLSVKRVSTWWFSPSIKRCNGIGGKAFWTWGLFPMLRHHQFKFRNSQDLAMSLQEVYPYFTMNSPFCREKCMGRAQSSVSWTMWSDLGWIGWIFHEWFINGGCPNGWMLFTMENPNLKWMIWG